MLHQPHFCWPWYLQFSSWLWAGCLHSEQVSSRRFLGATMAHRRYFCTPFFMKPGPNMPQSRTSMNEVLASWKIHMRPTWLASKLPSDGEMPANSAWDEVLSGSSSRSMGNSVSPTGTFVRSKPVHWWMACSETLIFEPILSSVSSPKPEVSHSATHNSSFGDAITSCELLMCYDKLERLEPLSVASRNTLLSEPLLVCVFLYCHMPCMSTFAKKQPTSLSSFLAEHPGPLQISSDLNHCAQSRKLPSERICLRVHDLSIQFIFKNRLAFLCYAQCEHMPGKEIWAPHDEQSLQDFFLQPPSLPSNDQCDQSYAFRQVCGWTTLERLQRKDACLENHLPSDRLREGQINLSFLHQNNEHEDYYIIDDIVWYTAAWEPQYIIMIYIKILYYMSMDIESHTQGESERCCEDGILSTKWQFGGRWFSMFFLDRVIFTCKVRGHSKSTRRSKTMMLLFCMKQRIILQYTQKPLLKRCLSSNSMRSCLFFLITSSLTLLVRDQKKYENPRNISQGSTNAQPLPLCAYSTNMWYLQCRVLTCLCHPLRPLPVKCKVDTGTWNK